MIDKRIFRHCWERPRRVSQEKKMRGQRDRTFAARKQLRECVGNVEEGSLGKGKGAGAYLKTL